MKKRMLYLSHVDWNWIKQRPHFLAEGLSEFLDVSIAYLYQNRNRKTLQKRDFRGQEITPIYTIPFANRFGVTRKINDRFLRFQFCRQIKRVNPEYLYLTFPSQEAMLPKEFSGTLIYDCMDDHVAMAPVGRKQQIRQQEFRLLQEASVVVVSSENLRRVLIERYGEDLGRKMHIVRNGYGGEILSVPPRAFEKKETFTLAYIGTVGPWFNFDFILRSLKDIPNLRYKIIGPSDLVLPQSEGIVYTGTVEHDKLYEVIKDADGLTMPFTVNDVVASVDPVKLYEYINYNMNVLCVRYPEIERFDPFVFFYEDYDSFVKQIRCMMQNNTVKYGAADRVSFLKENSWASRVDSILSLLSETESDQ